MDVEANRRRNGEKSRREIVFEMVGLVRHTG